jgi:hypothetical protein
LAFRQRACTAMGHLYSSAAVKLVLPYLTKLPLPLPVQGRVHSLLQSAVPPAGRPSSAAAGSGVCHLGWAKVRLPCSSYICLFLCVPASRCQCTTGPFPTAFRCPWQRPLP